MVEIPPGGFQQLRREAAPKIIADLVEMEKAIVNAICTMQRIGETGRTNSLDRTIPSVSEALHELNERLGSVEYLMRHAHID